MAAKFTLNPAGVGEFLKTDPALREKLAAHVRSGVEYAQSIAPVGDATEGGAYTRSGRKPGDYRAGLRGEVVEGRNRLTGRVVSTDFKSHWIEYGSARMPKRRVLGRTMDHLKGH